MPFAPIHPGDIVSAEHLTHIITGLRNRTLPKTEWTHGAHLVSAVALINELGLQRAIEAMPDIIRGYNESVGGINSDTEGYHHTITIFYLEMINEFCARHPGAPEKQASTLLASPQADKAYPLKFYSKEMLFSVEARRGYVAPDIKAYPGMGGK